MKENNRVRIRLKVEGDWPIGKDEVAGMAAEVVEGLAGDTRVELSLLIIGEREARELNRKFRGMEYVPQVLAFPMSRVADEDGWTRWGDVVICWPKLEEEILLTGRPEKEVLREWLIHGIKNLLK